MIIKVQKENGSLEWLVIDGAEEVTYNNSPLPFDHHNAVDPKKPDERVHQFLIRKEWGDEIGHAYTANIIKYTKENIRYLLVFDGIAYICNDRGETVQKIKSAGYLDNRIGKV